MNTTLYTGGKSDHHLFDKKVKNHCFKALLKSSKNCEIANFVEQI